MTPSEQAKAAGLDSLAQVARATGQSARTLINWHKHKPDLFEAVLKGVSSLAHVKWIKWADEKPECTGVYLTYWSDGALETYAIGIDELDKEEIIVGKRRQDTLICWAENVEPPK